MDSLVMLLLLLLFRDRLLFYDKVGPPSGTQAPTPTIPRVLPRCVLRCRSEQGKCLYYREWNRPQNTLENADDDGEEQRLMFGMLYSLKVRNQAQKRYTA